MILPLSASSYIAPAAQRSTKAISPRTPICAQPTLTTKTPLTECQEHGYWSVSVVHQGSDASCTPKLTNASSCFGSHCIIWSHQNEHGTQL